MKLIAVVLQKSQEMSKLQAGLAKDLGPVACYQRGRRTAGGPVHMAELWLKHNSPQYIANPVAFLMPVTEALLYDVIDSLLSLVSRLEDPACARIDVLEVGHIAASRQEAGDGVGE